ncbi:hypothetical protein FJY90_04175 [Candidatus Gottesmanbacteria bacterium]|nr:hypothetical protein [Candidatus Gottesmanbacteria bacterium]
MISISGIKYQKELEELPYFNKNQAGLLIDKRGKNLDKKLEQLVRKGYLMPLKKGYYTTSLFYEKSNRESFSEYIANRLRNPSYISLEYVLAKEGVIPEAVFAITSITVKTSRNYINSLGNFIYKNIKADLFCGYSQKNWEDKIIYIATLGKALFDFLYLKKMDGVGREVFSDLRINFGRLNNDDLAEFEKYAAVSSSPKMVRILRLLKSK